MEFYMSFSKAPEESYSRHIDREVSAQEYPYGVDYKEHFIENAGLVDRITRENVRGTNDLRRKRDKK